MSLTVQEAAARLEQAGLTEIEADLLVRLADTPPGDALSRLRALSANTGRRLGELLLLLHPLSCAPGQRGLLRVRSQGPLASPKHLELTETGVAASILVRPVVMDFPDAA